MLDKCGEQHGQFYDRRGDYFREGIDPRNSFGRFVNLGIRKVDRHVYWLDKGYSELPASGVRINIDAALDHG